MLRGGYKFIRIDNDDPRGPQIIFDCGTITVKIDRNLRHTITNDDTGYEFGGVPPSDLNEMDEIAREKFGLPTKDKVEIKIEIQPEGEEFCPRCGYYLGKTEEAAKTEECPDCNFQLKTTERPREEDGVLRRTFKHGTWVKQ